MAPICSVCGNTHKRMRRNGMCDICYQSAQRDGTLKRTAKQTYGERSCSSCQSIGLYFKGLCRACYRASAGLSVDAVKPTKCEAGGCDGVIVSHGLCQKHSRRLERHGDVGAGRPDGWGAKSSHPMYERWAWAKRDGGRSQEWDDFWKFVADVGEKPGSRYRLVRKNDKRPWTKENTEWVPPILDGDDAIKILKGNALYQRIFRLKRPQSGRRSLLKQLYGLSLESYNKILSSQSGVCAICSNSETSKHHTTGEVRMLAVDHCHDSGAVRGLLCSSCNIGIGCLRDDPDLLQKAITYIHKHKKTKAA